ncbi:PSL4 [Symbiodinium sp. KB8]|nr:PSL4 [Symbiodinium sp. KB8]
MPLSKVNDDFCDCPDGSDEPGTGEANLPHARAAACANGKFYCVNKGFRGVYLPSSRVGDGVCDCCDGSDEPGTCADTCDEAGAEWRKAEAERIQRAEAGAKAKVAFLEAGKAHLEGKEAALAAAKSAADAARSALEAAEAELADAEEKEKAALADIQSKGNDVIVRSLQLHTASRVQLLDMLLQLARNAPDGKRLLKDLAFDRAHKETPEGKAARDAVDLARGVLNERESELRSAEAAAEKDFGPGAAFYKLDGQCFDVKVQKYTYSVCPYGSAKQDQTSLGSWSGFQVEYTKMLFTGGATCWNGPQRTMTVTLECGATNALHSVDEPSKCQYSAVLQTPAVCDDLFAHPVDANLGQEHEDL